MSFLFDLEFQIDLLYKLLASGLNLHLFSTYLPRVMDDYDKNKYQKVGLDGLKCVGLENHRNTDFCQAVLKRSDASFIKNPFHTH